MSPVIVSKTDYLFWKECPKNAWIRKHKPEIFNSFRLSEFEKSIIETGNEVELKARELFPSAELQPTFSKDGFLAIADVLTYDEESRSHFIYEIKASNEVDEKRHIYDLAFQVLVLRKCGLSVTKSHIIHLNPEYIRKGEIDIIKLFHVENVTEKIEGLMPKVEFEMKTAYEYLSRAPEPKGHCSCIYKGRSKHCATFTYSNPDIPEYGVHDLARIGSSKKKLTELMDRNVFHIKDIPEDFKLTDIQKNQVDAYAFDRTILKKYDIGEELKKLIFPLYFLDYETFPSAIPRFNGFSPYQQIPFQYSLHIVEKADTEPTHKEFLYAESDDPSYAFVKSLQKNVGDKGSIVVWSKKFECRINEEIARRIPATKIFIDSINTRVYDLMDIFSKQHYVHKDFKGSTSIKAVLPVLAPELSYGNLEIREGGAASQKWNEMTTEKISAEAKNEITRNLKKYCELDTLAMYSIWIRLTSLYL